MAIYQGWACEWKKHIKARHAKPYGCAYPKCHKRFGAKSDWGAYKPKAPIDGQPADGGYKSRDVALGMEDAVDGDLGRY
jgi:hypothetical protein